MAIGPPFIVFAEFALLQQVAVVLGAEVIAEGRRQSPEMSDERSESQDDASDEDKSANEELGLCEVIHLVLLCRDLRGSQKGGWPGQRRTEMECESARAEWLFNIAQV
jgi:hypothetical protein